MSRLVGEQSQELAALTDQVDLIKEEIQQCSSDATDQGPLERVKAVLARLQTEVMIMPHLSAL